MPYSIEWQAQGACKRFEGEVSAAEFMRSIADLQGSERFDTLRYVINDFSAVVRHSIGPADVKLFAAFGIGAARTNPGIRLAVVSADPAIRALVDVYAKTAAGCFQLAVFAQYTAASEWAQSGVA